MESHSFLSLRSVLPMVEPGPTLLPRILRRIQELQLRRLRYELGVFLTALGALMGYIFWHRVTLAMEISSSSPFWGFLELLRTDPDIALASAREFLFALLEALPVESVLVGLIFLFLLLGIFALVQSIQKQRAFLRTHF